jgi:hypothetical protein
MPSTAESFIESLRPTLLALLSAIPGEPAAFSKALEPVACRNDTGVWQGLVDCASQHGVLGVIDRPLTTEARLPADVRDATERRLVIDQLWQEHMVNGLQDAVGALARAGVEACAMKGPVLAARLYPAGAIRHCLDLDLLVQADDFDRAVSALTEAGYTTPATGVSAAYMRLHSHHLGFSRAAAAPVELHFRTYAGFGVVLPAGVLFDRAEPFRLTETLTVLAPSPENEFIYLATHAAGHSFIRLVWLYDLKLLVRRYPSLDWDRIAHRAHALGVATPVAYTTRLLHDWLGVSTGTLSTQLLRRAVRTRIADWLLPEVSRPQPASMRDNFGGLLFTSLLCDRVGSGAWLLQHHILRAMKRRLKRAAPAYLPENWSA